MTGKPKRRRGLEVDCRSAIPDQVARTVLRIRPEKPLAPAGLFLVILSATSLEACGGGDGPTGPAGADATGVDFPAIDGNVAEALCVRGALPAPGRSDGSITPADCITAVTGDLLSTPVGVGSDSYFETWRLRVAERAVLRVSVSSGFDSFLDAYRVPDLSNPASAVYLDSGDDGAGGPSSLDAVLELSVAPSVEYWVMVSGFGSINRGPYTLMADVVP